MAGTDTEWLLDALRAVYAGDREMGAGMLDEVESMAARIAALEAALRAIVAEADFRKQEARYSDREDNYHHGVAAGAYISANIARCALEGGA